MPSTSSAGDEYIATPKLKIFEGLQNWARRQRKRTSPRPPHSMSPSPSPSFDSNSSEPSVQSSVLSGKHKNTTTTPDRLSKSEKHVSLFADYMRSLSPEVNYFNFESKRQDETEEINPLSSRIVARSARRRSSARPRDIVAPQNFDIKELLECPKLSHPPCRSSVGCVCQVLPEPGWRVTTRARSREFCFVSSRPLYSAQYQSPLDTGRPAVLYFEAKIRPENKEDTVCLTLGFVAGNDCVLRMPGFEPGTVGIQCRNGRVFMGNTLLDAAELPVFEPGDQLGFGIMFSERKKCGQKELNLSSLDIQMFVTREGRLVGIWDVRDSIGQSNCLHGFEGKHDLYAAVGTKGEVHADILFERKDWIFLPVQSLNR